MTESAPDDPDRLPTGRWRTGNRASTRHGLHSPRAEAPFQAARAAFLEQSLADAGGADALPARVRKLHEARARVQMRLEQVDNALSTLGLFDRRGQVRERLLLRLESLAGLALRLDTTLGLERKPRQLPTVHDYLADYRPAGATHDRPDHRSDHRPDARADDDDAR